MAQSAFDLKVNGQTLILTAFTVNGASTTLYSDTGCTAAVTLPAVVAADTTYYLNNPPRNANVASLTVTQVDGTDISPPSFALSWANYPNAVVSPLPSQAQLAADTGYAYDPNRMSDTHFDVVPRSSGMATNTGTTSGRLYLTYFTAIRPLTFNTITFATVGTAAATVTTIKYGFYTAAANGNATCVARTANDATLLTATTTAYPKAFDTDGGYPDSYTLVTGQRYAVGLLVVATTMPVMYAAGGGAAISGLSPVLVAYKASQSDIDTTPITSVTANSSGPFYCRLSYV